MTWTRPVLFCLTLCLSLSAHPHGPVPVMTGAKADFPGPFQDFSADPSNQSALDDGNEGDRPFRSLKGLLPKALGVWKTGRAVRIRLHPGLYRENLHILKVNGAGAPLVIEATESRKAILTGADAWTSFTPVAGAEGRWEAPWTDRWGEDPDLLKGYAGITTGKGSLDLDVFSTRREVVSFEGNLLFPVSNRSLLEPGTFFVDEAGGRLILQLAPGQRPDRTAVEVARRPGLIAEPRSILHLNETGNVLIKGLVVRHSAGDSAAVTIRKAAHIRVEDCDFNEASRTALNVTLCRDITLRGLRMNRNGWCGFGGDRTTNLVMEGGEANSNNWRNGNQGWRATPVKFGHCSRILVRDMLMEGNRGKPLWFDTEVYDIVVDRVVAVNNTSGLYFEASTGPFYLFNSVMVGNTRGLILHDSARHHVVSNLILSNKESLAFWSSLFWERGIKVRQQSATQLTNLLFTHNTVLASEKTDTAFLGSAQAPDRPEGWRAAFLASLTLTGNRFWHAAVERPFYGVENEPRTLNEFLPMVKKSADSVWSKEEAEKAYPFAMERIEAMRRRFAMLPP